MKKCSVISCLLLSGVMMSAELPYLRADRPTAVYKVGEEIVFQVQKPGEGRKYTVHDGKQVIAEAVLTADPIKVKAAAPGFILVSVDCGKDEKGKPCMTYAGAAIEPEKIQPGTERPADFDEFWRKELEGLHASPLKFSETPLPENALPAGFIGYDVQISRGDVIATGYLVLPKDAKEKSLPGIMSYLGASKVTAELPVAISYAKFNALSFNSNFHGLPNFLDRSPAVLTANRKATENYRYAKSESLKEYAMRKIFLRTVLVAEYLQQRPEYDGRHLVAAGGSLGGCQALVCAALVPEVTFCVSLATAMCDHYGAKAGHLPGWPNIMVKRGAKTGNNAAYFDVVNFAPWAKCPVYMAVGFIDTTCPPASTYAAYNSLKTQEHAMAHTVTSGHGGKCLDRRDRGVFHFWDDQIRKHIKK